MSKYKNEHKRVADIVRQKAEQNGKSKWGFTYRGQDVEVSGVKLPNGKVKITTTPVKNK